MKTKMNSNDKDEKSALQNAEPKANATVKYTWSRSKISAAIKTVMIIYGLLLTTRIYYKWSEYMLNNGISAGSNKYLFDKDTSRAHLELAQVTSENNQDQLIIAKHGAVACDVPRCSTLAVEILKKGGSAMDAAVTTALCIGSINSFSSGIGGGGFLVVKSEGQQATAFNCREKAGRLASKDMFNGDNWKSKLGGLAVGVPGELKGLYEAWEMYGKLSWKEIIDPVVKINRYGFRIDEPLAQAIKTLEAAAVLSDDVKKHFDWLYDTESNTFAQLGQWVYRPNFANTLEMIANNGSDKIFYDPEGPIAPKLVNIIHKTGGTLELDDFVGYDVVVSDAISTSFKGRTVYTAPNPASGPMLLHGLNILDGYNDSEDSGNSGVATQRLVESMKWMGSGRSQLGDPVDLNNTAAIAELMTKRWADEVRENISDTHTHPWQFYHPAYESKDPHGTAHFSVVDADGMAVSMTTTVNLLFGSLVVDPYTGIVLNNEMDDFSTPGAKNAFDLEPSIFNYVAPYKRPLSSCVPSIVTNTETGRVELAIGAAGGSRILTTVFQGIVRKLSYGLSLLDVISNPRLHHQLLPHIAYLEFGTPDDIKMDLESRGHEVEFHTAGSVMNGIYVDPGTKLIHAVSDFWRKRGRADGY